MKIKLKNEGRDKQINQYIKEIFRWIDIEINEDKIKEKNRQRQRERERER